VGPIVLPPGVAPRDILVAVDLEAIAVELNLVDPIIGAGDPVDLRCKQWFDVIRKWSALRVGQIGRVDAGWRIDTLHVLALGV
jgi:hypothetical protein